MAQPQIQPFQPLEYWKPPKAVLHYTRPKTAAQRSPSVYSFSSSKLETASRNSFEFDEKLERRPTSYSSAIADMKNQFTETVGEGADTSASRWYNFKAWGKKTWLGIATVVTILIVVIVVAVVEVNKSNKYPDYSKLTYFVSETCMLFILVFTLTH